MISVTYAPLPFFFFPKIVKTILSSQAIQKQVAGWFWPAGHCFLIPELENNIFILEPKFKDAVSNHV